MEFAFVSAGGFGIEAGAPRLAISKKAARVISPSRRNALMMAADSSGEKQSLGQWFLDRFMHNFGNDYGYETYFKPAEKAREAEMKRVRDEVDNEKNE